MSVINPNETAKVWKAQRREASIQLHLSGAEGDAAELIGTRVGGYPLDLHIVPTNEWIDANDLDNAVVGVIQVDPDSPASIKRFQKLVASSKAPLIAAAYDPPLALVRSLLRAGAHDVLPLPLDITDLETSLAPLKEAKVATTAPTVQNRPARVVTVIKSSGGVGATAMLTQLAVQFAKLETAAGREACLMDLDIQFGDAAFQLGLKTKLSLGDLIEAGTRLDGDLLRAAATEHPSGLRVIASPPEMMPIEALQSDQLVDIVEVAAREFGTLLVDLPSNWTNWSLSVLARSDLVILMTELSIPALHRARRQLDLLESQDLNNLNVRVVVNRHEKSMFGALKASDVQKALGRDVAYTLTADAPLVRAAMDRGITIFDVKRKSALGKDIEALDAGVAAALGLDRKA